MAGLIRFVPSPFNNDDLPAGGCTAIRNTAPPFEIFLRRRDIAEWIIDEYCVWLAHAIFAFGATDTTPGTCRPNSCTNNSMPFKAAELSESAAIG